MRSFLGLVGFCLVVWGPAFCRDPYTKFGMWALAASGDWVYRRENAAYDSGRKTFHRGRLTRAACPFKDEQLAYWWHSGWDDAAQTYLAAVNDDSITNAT